MAEALKIITPESITYDLTAFADFSLLRGMTGHGAPPYDLISEEVPGQPGTREQFVKTNSRIVEIPLLITASTRQALINYERALARDLDPNLGNLTIEYTDPASVTRVLTAKKVSGFNGDTSAGAHGVVYSKNILVFEASDPYWYAKNVVSDTYLVGETAGWFPIFPLTLTSTTVFSQPTVINSGDVAAWPVWTINGPGNTILLTNLTSGLLIDLPTTLLTGEFITIDTRPGAKTVTLNVGGAESSLFETMVKPDSSLWPLLRGTNKIKIGMNGADANSSVVLAYYPRYNHL